MRVGGGNDQGGNRIVSKEVVDNEGILVGWRCWCRVGVDRWV
jgi:hypothetical protein